MHVPAATAVQDEKTRWQRQHNERPLIPVDRILLDGLLRPEQVFQGGPGSNSPTSLRGAAFPSRRFGPLQGTLRLPFLPAGDLVDTCL